jgi:hypothetical protein
LLYEGMLLIFGNYTKSHGSDGHHGSNLVFNGSGGKVFFTL